MIVDYNRLNGGGNSSDEDKGFQKEVPGFIAKAFEIFSDPAWSDYCGWAGDTIVIHKINEFANDVLPLYYKHSNYSSFVRQLNMYDFHKTVANPQIGEFQHDKFLKGRPDLLHLIKRKVRKHTPGSGSTNQGQGSRSTLGSGEFSPQQQDSMAEPVVKPPAVPKRKPRSPGVVHKNDKLDIFLDTPDATLVPAANATVVSATDPPGLCALSAPTLVPGLGSPDNDCNKRKVQVLSDDPQGRAHRKRHEPASKRNSVAKNNDIDTDADLSDTADITNDIMTGDERPDQRSTTSAAAANPSGPDNSQGYMQGYDLPIGPNEHDSEGFVGGRSWQVAVERHLHGCKAEIQALRNENQTLKQCLRDTDRRMDALLNFTYSTIKASTCSTLDPRAAPGEATHTVKLNVAAGGLNKLHAANHSAPSLDSLPKPVGPQGHSLDYGARAHATGMTVASRDLTSARCSSGKNSAPPPVTNAMAPVATPQLHLSGRADSSPKLSPRASWSPGYQWSPNLPLAGNNDPMSEDPIDGLFDLDRVFDETEGGSSKEQAKLD